MRVMQHFIEGRDVDYYLTDLIHAGVSWGTLNTLFPLLLKADLIRKTRKISRATLYTINKENETAKKFIELYDSLVQKVLQDTLQKSAYTNQ